MRTNQTAWESFQGEVPRKRVLWIDILRGEAMLLTIIGHLIIIGRINYKFFSWIYLFHMPLFFFVSGSIPLKDYSFTQWIQKRTKKLLVPYFILGAIYLIIKYLIFDYYSRTWKLLPSLECYFTGRSIGPLWFLPTLFLVELLFWSLRRSFRNEICLLTWVLFLGVYGHVLNAYMPRDLNGICTNYPWHLNAVPIMLGFYYLGSKQQTLRNLFLWANRKMILAVLAIACMTLTVFSLFHNSQIDINYGWYGRHFVFFYPCAICGIFLMMMVAWGIERYDFIGLKRD